MTTLEAALVAGMQDSLEGCVTERSFLRFAKPYVHKYRGPRLRAIHKRPSKIKWQKFGEHLLARIRIMKDILQARLDALPEESNP